MNRKMNGPTVESMDRDAQRADNAHDDNVARMLDEERERSARLCKDCRHHVPHDSPNYADGSLDKCAISDRPVSRIRGVATGYCETERSRNWLEARIWNYCGNEGRKWVAK